MKNLFFISFLFLNYNTLFGSSLEDNENILLHDDLSSEDKNIEKAENCFCKAGCFYGSGDSYHFVENYDVSCNLSYDEKVDVVAKKMVSHYLTQHGFNAINSFRENVKVTCYSSSSN